MKKPLVSIIIPAYNAQKTIKKTIQSALEQTYKNIEIIVVDDGSTDNALKIINSKKDSRIQVYTQENKGPSAARNYGASKAKGKYLSFLDADDLWEKNKLKEEIDLLQIKKEKIIFSGAVVIRKNAKKLYYVFKNPFEKIFLCNPAVCGSNLTIEKAIFQQYLYGEQLSFKEDYELLLRIFYDNTILYNPKLRVFYNQKKKRVSSLWKKNRDFLQSHKQNKTLTFASFFDLCYFSNMFLVLLPLLFVYNPGLFIKKSYLSFELRNKKL